MKHNSLLTHLKHSLLLGLFVGTWIGAAELARGQAAGDLVPDRYIVVLKGGANAAAVAAGHGLAPDMVYTHALNGFAGVIPAARLRALLRNPQVDWVEVDQVVTTGAQTVPWGVNRVEADLNVTAKIDGLDERVNVDIAIIDTGIQLTHPDLNVFKNVSFVSGAKTGNDDNGHGTHVAGTTAALDNGVGVVGIAPGARLWAVKVLDRNGSGTMSGVIKGVDYVTANATSIEVANMSLGGGNSAALNTAIANSAAKGVVYAVAAGNSGVDAGGTSPANSPDVLCVSAIVDTDGIWGGIGLGTSYGADDTFATFSNFGAVVDIAAPGVNVLSTYKGGAYATMSGTSMASPHVAGAVGLYLATRAKPTTADGATAVRNAIIAVGIPQNDVRGFSGGKSAEPLLYTKDL